MNILAPYAITEQISFCYIFSPNISRSSSAQSQASFFRESSRRSGFQRKRKNTFSLGCDKWFIQTKARDGWKPAVISRQVRCVITPLLRGTQFKYVWRLESHSSFLHSSIVAGRPKIISVFLPHNTFDNWKIVKLLKSGQIRVKLNWQPQKYVPTSHSRPRCCMQS